MHVLIVPGAKYCLFLYIFRAEYKESSFCYSCAVRVSGCTACTFIEVDNNFACTTCSSGSVITST